MPLFQLGSAVDRQGPINPDDILRTKRVLNKLGHYPIPNHGITDFTDDEMFEGVEAFQRERGLPVDGVMTPDGPTARAINVELREGDMAAGTNLAERKVVPLGLFLVKGDRIRAGRMFAGPRGQSESGSSSRSSPAAGGNDSLAGGTLNDPLLQPGLATPKVFGHAGAIIGKSLGIEETHRSVEQDFREFEAGAQGVLARFAVEGIDANRMRNKYLETTKKAFDETNTKVKAKKLSAYQGALSSHKTRGELMEATRRESTRLSAAIAKAMKGSNPPISFYQDKYADVVKPGLPKSKMIDLSFEQEKQVWIKIIASAGRPNKVDTERAKRAGVAGRAFLGIGVALAIVNVLDAEDKLESALRETAKFAGGVVGGAVGGATIGSVTANPFGILVGVIAGGVLGAMGADVSVDKIMEFLE